MADLQTVDLDFLGVRRVIACFLAPTARGFVLFESGPASTLDVLEKGIAAAGFEIGALEAIFATHVHLDHSGGAGALARRTGCRVYAHPIGAPHLVDPEAKLLPSAQRLYGDMLEPLWGRIEAVPADQVVDVADGETVTVSGLDVTAHYTPGHAAHHIAWQVGSEIVTGDVAGVRFPGADHVLPPMPPPDIDVEMWFRSIERLRDLKPKRLLLTHFGGFDDAARHLDELEDRLRRWTAIAEEIVARDGAAEELGVALAELDDREIAAQQIAADTVERYRRLCPMAENSTGLWRYCATRRPG